VLTVWLNAVDKIDELILLPNFLPPPEGGDWVAVGATREGDVVADLDLRVALDLHDRRRNCNMWEHIDQEMERRGQRWSWGPVRYCFWPPCLTSLHGTGSRPLTSLTAARGLAAHRAVLIF
jgi:hypothetical protein